MQGNPDDAGERLLLEAIAQHELGQKEAALESCRQLIERLRTWSLRRELQPLAFNMLTATAGLNQSQARVLIKQHVFNIELNRLAKEIDAKPESPAKVFARALRFSAGLGRWRESRPTACGEMKLAPKNRNAWMRLGFCLLFAGDEHAYRQHCRAMVAQFRGTKDASIAEALCKLSLLLPGTIELSELPSRLLREASTDPKWKKSQDWFSLCCALISHREGNYEESLALTKALSTLPGNLGAQTLVLRAMAEHQLGQKDQARKTLAQAEVLIPPELRTLGTADYDGPLPVPVDTVNQGFMFAEILRREAAALINGSPLKKAQDQK